MDESRSPVLPAPPLPTMQTTNVKAIVALVAGIVGVVFVPLVGSIVALVFGYLAKREIDDSEGRQDGRSQAISAIVLGWIGLAIAVVFVAMFWSIFSDFESV